MNEARIVYTNHRGETAIRRIIPQGIIFGCTEWHPRDQWLLQAFDLEKRADRVFALADVKAWLLPDAGALAAVVPPSPTPPPAEAKVEGPLVESESVSHPGTILRLREKRGLEPRRQPTEEEIDYLAGLREAQRR